MTFPVLEEEIFEEFSKVSWNLLVKNAFSVFKM